MTLEELLENFLICIIAACAVLCIGTKNPIHSIMFLIATFIQGSFFLMFLKLPFFALLFAIVYVGAIVVLFLFIVMLLELKTVNTSDSYIEFLPIFGICIGIITFHILYFNWSGHSLRILPQDIKETIFQYKSDLILYFLDTNFGNNIKALGKILYTSYLFEFLEIAYILFLAMIGAIVISLKTEKFETSTVKHQDPVIQGLKNINTSIYYSMNNNNNIKWNSFTKKKMLYMKGFPKLIDYKHANYKSINK